MSHGRNTDETLIRKYQLSFAFIILPSHYSAILFRLIRVLPYFIRG